MAPRTLLKWVHWLSAGFILYFFLVEPEDVDRLGAAALATHAGAGLLLALVVAVWTAQYVRKGLLAKAGPKLPPVLKPWFPLAHKIIYWLLPVMVLSGAAAGFAAPYIIYAFGILPISFGIGTENLHGFFEEIHEIVFNVLLAVILGHTLFHLWRHIRLKDNALRIIMPKALHRFL